MIKTEITPELIFKLYENCDSFKHLLYELGVKFSVEVGAMRVKLKFEIERHSSEESSVITSLSVGKDYYRSLMSYCYENDFPDRSRDRRKITPLSAYEWVVHLKNASQKETFYYKFNKGYPERFWSEIEKFEPVYGKTNIQKMIECIA